MLKNKVEISSVRTSGLPALSYEKSDELMRKIKQGDKKAREEFIIGNLRLVLSSIQQFSGKKEYADDLFQIGTVGLLKAVDNFDSEIGVRFSTYAVPTVILR